MNKLKGCYETLVCHPPTHMEGKESGWVIDAFN